MPGSVPDAVKTHLPHLIIINFKESFLADENSEVQKNDGTFQLVAIPVFKICICSATSNYLNIYFLV